MTTGPEADPARDNLLERLTADLDRRAARKNGDVEGREGLGGAVAAALAQESAWGGPPADLRATVLARVAAAKAAQDAQAERDAQADRDAPADQPEPAPRTEPERGEVPRAEAPPQLATVTPLRPRWQRLTVAVPVAAAAAAVVTLAVLGVQQVLEPSPHAVITVAGNGYTAEVATISRPSGFEITLDTDELPAAPEGHYYGAWLRRAPGNENVVPIGTFHGRRTGEPIVLWSGVDPAEYSTFSVTLQQEGGELSPSSTRVLSGEFPD